MDFIRQRNHQAGKLLNNNTATHAVAENLINLPFFLPVVETNKGLLSADDDFGNGLSTKQQLINKTSNRKRRGLLDKNFEHAIEPIQGLSMRLIQAKSNDECKCYWCIF